jgi:PAS domain S-box-containing protein
MKRPSILLVEDNAVLRERLRALLSAEGYEVKTTGSGEEALALINKEHFAVCLIDSKLPDMTGLELVRELNELDPPAHSILITPFAARETGLAALKAGAYTFIEQPIHDEELRAVINRAVEVNQLHVERGERMEEALRVSEANYRALEESTRSVLESLPEAITITDLNATIVDCTKATVQMHGFSDKEELIGKTALHLIAPRDHQRALANLEKSLTQGFVRDIEYTFLTKDGGEFHAELSASVKKDSDGKPIGFVAITKDITGRKRAEEELKKQMRELERANRDLEDFTSTVSHDLKVPLRSLQAFSTLLMDDYAEFLNDTGRGYLRRVKEATERMEALIEDLLTLSRVGRKFTEVETVNLGELVEEIKSDLSARIRERGGEVVVAGKLPTLSTQRVWMKELFMNLIDNGLKFNKSEKPRVAVSSEEREGEYLFTVKDNGIGIDEKYQAHIFKLFERVHSPYEYEGTGAGLAICKKIVNELGGSIWVESRSGEGSTFYFTLPRN